MRIDIARRLRVAAALMVLSAIVGTSAPSAFAQTVTGTLSGTITSSQENSKLAGVTVTAVAPSGRYNAKTDQSGFFSINGVTPDTYAVQFTIEGYETFTIQGITVVQGQIANVSSALNKSLTRIGRTQARSPSGAFQPTQTTDQYNIGTQQMQTQLGKAGGASEALLLASIPGASFDVNGFPVLRGGRETEEGFQFEGIDFTDAFTHQFVNSLILNGASNFQVTPGAGDASIGNVGTGAINIVAKRGTHPAFGLVEGDVRSGRYEHLARGEYGWASANGRFSEYASVFFDRNAYAYGGKGADPLLIGAYFTGRTYDKANDVVSNFVYKFGRDNNQSLQFFYDNTQFELRFGYGVGPNGLPYKDNDPQWLTNAQANLGIATPFIQALLPFTFGQRSLTDRIGVGSDRKPINGNQPNETFKLQYSNSLDASTFVTAKFYRVNSVSLFDSPYNANGVVNSDFSGLQGGLRTGISLDGTKQLGSKNLLGFGAKYEYLTPVYSSPSATNAAFTYGGFANSIETADFISPANCPYGGFGLAPNPATGSPCGYLFGQGFAPYRVGNGVSLATGLNTGAPLPLALQLPYADNSTHTPRQDVAFYIKDTFSPTARLKMDIGLRVDAVNWKYPTCDIQWCLPTSFTTTGGVNTYAFNYAQDTRSPRVWQPRGAIAYQATKNDALRFSYGRSVQFAPIAAVDVTSPNANQTWAAFLNVPSRDSTTGTTAMFCGTSAFLGLGIQDQPCANYAQQLRWENQNFNAGVPIQPLLPTTFNNFDFSYSHQFPHQVSLKVTPFYSKAFNQVAATSNPILKNGQPLLDVTGNPILGPQIQTNLGKNQTTGVEFFLTKEAAFGLSGSLSLTYQNEFSNVVPTSGSEDFFPSIPPESLRLGNTYRVGFLSPFVGSIALQERTRSGWRINPVFFYNRGFPISPGLITAASVNGSPFNLPNTNVTNSAQLAGAAGADRYVDPRNPGSVFTPNIAATRGTSDTNAAGGILSNPSVAAQLTIEYSPPKNPHSTFGALINNLFNQIYAQPPAFNTRYQPVATGIAGPYTGYTSAATNPAFYGVRNFLPFVGGNMPYLIQPNGNPRTVNFYYQLSL